MMTWTPNLIHNAINTFANRLPMLTLAANAQIKLAISNDEKLKTSIDKNRAIIENCKSQEIKQVYEALNKILLEAYLANLGDWLIYVIPVAILVGTWKRVVTDCKKLIVVPHRDIGRILPNHDRTSTC